MQADGTGFKRRQSNGCCDGGMPGAVTRVWVWVWRQVLIWAVVAAIYFDASTGLLTLIIVPHMGRVGETAIQLAAPLHPC